jgi:hypothetical protein
MSSRGLVTTVVLVVWVLLGPIAMAFGGCAGMGAMCEGPCGLTSCVVPVWTSAAMPSPVVYLGFGLSDHFPTTLLEIPEPPPRSSSLSA